MTTIDRITEPTLRDAAHHIIRFAEGMIDGWAYAYISGHCEAEEYHRQRDLMLGVISDRLAALAAPDCGACGGWGQRLVVARDANGTDIDADAMPCVCTGYECGPVTL